MRRFLLLLGLIALVRTLVGRDNEDDCYDPPDMATGDPHRRRIPVNEITENPQGATKRLLSDLPEGMAALLTSFLKEDAALEAVFEWRFSELAKAGFDDLYAVAIAITSDPDAWRRATEYVEAGCPHRLAVEIVL